MHLYRQPIILFGIVLPTVATAVKAKNEILEESTLEANQKFPNLDIVYSDRLFNAKIGVPDLAADCFHPNSKGQQKLSMNVWDDQPWFQ